MYVLQIRPIRCCTTGSRYHVMSAGTSGTPCTVSVSVASTLSLACSADMTSPEVGGVVNRACAVRWQRLMTSGRYGNVTTSSSGRYSVWKIERPASDSSDDDDDDDEEDSAAGVVNVLQVTSVQREDFTRCVLILVIYQFNIDQ